MNSEWWKGVAEWFIDQFYRHSLKVLVAVLVMVGVSYMTSAQDKAMYETVQKAERIKLKLQMTGVK